MLQFVTAAAGFACVVLAAVAFVVIARRTPIEDVAAGSFHPIAAPDRPTPNEWSEQHWLRGLLVAARRSPMQWQQVVERLRALDADLDVRSGDQGCDPFDGAPDKFNQAWLDRRLLELERRSGLDALVAAPHAPPDRRAVNDLTMSDFAGVQESGPNASGSRAT